MITGQSPMRRAHKIAPLFALAFFLVSACGGSAKPPHPPPPAETPKGYAWRGDGSGVFPKSTPPIEWDVEAKKHILWSTKIGLGKFSSPIVVGDKVFVLAEPADLICLDAASGKILWQKPNGFAELATKTEERKAKDSPGNVTPIPVSDGRRVYVSFGCGIVGCYDLDGNRQWLVFIDQPPGTQHGRSASPLLAGDTLLVSIHHLIALDTKTGKLVWQNEKKHLGTVIFCEDFCGRNPQPDVCREMVEVNGVEHLWAEIFDGRVGLAGWRIKVAFRVPSAAVLSTDSRAMDGDALSGGGARRQPRTVGCPGHTLGFSS